MIRSDSYLKGGKYSIISRHLASIKWCRFSTSQRRSISSCQNIWRHFTAISGGSSWGIWSSFESARQFPFIIPNSKGSQMSDPVITINSQSITSRLSTTALLGEVKSNLLHCSGVDGWMDAFYKCSSNGSWIIDLNLAKSSIANLTLSLHYILHSKQPVVIYLVTVSK